MKRPKRFEVGQVWINKKDYPDTIFTISRVNDSGVFSFRQTQGRKTVESLLSYAGTLPSELGTCWEVFSEEEYNKNDWRSWVHKAPGECPCGMLRSLCDYHRN